MPSSHLIHEVVSHYEPLQDAPMIWSNFKYDGFIVPRWMIGTGDIWSPDTIGMEEHHAIQVLVAWSLCISLLTPPTLGQFQSDLTDWQESQRSKPLTHCMKTSSWEEENFQPGVQTREGLVELSCICSAEAGTVTNWPSWLLTSVQWGCYTTQEKELDALWLVRKSNIKGQWLKSVRNPAAFSGPLSSQFLEVNYPGWFGP